MKRIYIAVALLLITATVSVFELIYVGSQSQTTTDRIQQIDRLVADGDFTAAQSACATLESDWRSIAEKIDILLIHDYVDNIGMNISKMRADIETKNASAYFWESAGAKKGLASIKGSEYPNLENIL